LNNDRDKKDSNTNQIDSIIFSGKEFKPDVYSWWRYQKEERHVVLLGKKKQCAVAVSAWLLSVRHWTII